VWRSAVRSAHSCGRGDRPSGLWFGDVVDETCAGRGDARRGACPEELVGIWVGKLGSSTNGSLYEPGLFTMRIHADGTTDVFHPGANVAKACVTQTLCDQHSIKAGGGRLTIGDTFSCVDSAEYSYKLEGDEMTTKRVKDDCGLERAHLYDGTVWRRRSS
jgi:hypothetical protein